MRTIHIGIGHDNDLVVTQFCDIEVFMDTRSESSDHGFDLGISIDFIQSRFLHVQNFSTQWKDCLCRTASCGLGRAAGGITLYDIDFTVFGSLSEQSASFPGRDIPSNAVFLLVRSRALRAASRARCASRDFSQMVFATVGFCSRK